MSATIYASFVDSIFNQDAAKQTTVEEIIDLVRSDRYKALTDQIRQETADERTKELKASLPAFLPSIVLDSQGKVSDDSVPTGVVQFDIDAKDNRGLNFSRLKEEVIRLPECLYAFTSPRGGLKFGILTDFSHVEGSGVESMKVRFKQAYKICKKYVEQSMSVTFELDNSVQSIRQSCWLSHDPDAFFQDQCVALPVDDQCVFSPVEYLIVAGGPSDTAAVQLALDQIPRTLKYDDRRSVNLCVLGMLHADGIPLLKNHWLTDDHEKLSRQLEECLQRAEYGSIALLWSIARKHGYTGPTGKQRWKVTPEPCDLVLEPLSTVEEAQAKLTDIVHDFIVNKRSQFINVTAGAGKTQTILKILAKEVPWNTNVLFLVPTHQLATEIVERFNAIKTENARTATTFRDKFKGGNVVALKGRDSLCENRVLLKKYTDSDVSMPLAECLRGCHLQGDCHYTAQFNNPLGNIRVMTHHEWSNQQSVWFHGAQRDGDGYRPKDRRNGWVPDYIVIDENIFTSSRYPDRETMASQFQSLRQVIQSVNSGKSLKEAALEHRSAIFSDSRFNYRRSEKFTETDIYISEKKDMKNRFSAIFHQLHEFCRTEEASLLDGMWVESDAILWLQVKTAADRYADVPTLFLDATANREVVRQLLPRVPFHRIAIKSKDDVNLYQMSDKTLTKDSLANPEKFKAVAAGLKKIATSYKNVGLITYKGVRQGEDDFYKKLAAEIDAHHFTYFGNLRGINGFEEVDCLLVVGRHFLPTTASGNLARAIFDHKDKHQSAYANLPVRMKDGSVYKLNSYIAGDSNHQAIYEHFSLSETLQAIGRARPVHGCKKDIFVFANENLSLDTEVTGFFSYEDHFGNPTALPKPVSTLLSPETLDQIKERGYLQVKEGELADQLGLTRRQVKTKKPQIEAELTIAGMTKQSFEGRYSNGCRWARDYFVFGTCNKLEQALKLNNEKLL
ncbi:BT4734/BF3469 family protein [Noviherbaspirillum malthae]|uniref:BT4734/BF3469 family protein n=1 Tax=Noviherbaspirillum malthae TaxID=1260987 RepID=UPI00188E0A31|nr:BT4734/BF3469 family protein [Noviherbaspirillum malthae]